MTVIANSLLLIVTLVIGNWIWGSISRSISRIPHLTASWNDWVERKPQRSIAQRGYDTYSKASKSFVYKNMNILPPSLFGEVRKLPSTVLNSSAANEEFLSLARCLGADYWDVIPFVRQNVIRSIAAQVSPVRDEVSHQLKKNFTSPSGSKDWCSVPLWATTFNMMGPIAARFLVGRPLSDDDEFTTMVGKFARSVGIESVLLKQFPYALRPFVNLFLGTNKKVRYLMEKMRPHVMASLKETDDGRVVAIERESHPDDGLLHQFVEYVAPKYADAAKTPAQLKERILHEVAGRWLGIFFAAIDTTTITFSHTCFDLVSNPRAKFADVIRDEINTVLAKYNGRWNAEAVGELKHLDSFIHESQRLHPVGIALAGRKIMSPGGHTFSNGDHFPQGAVIQLPIWYVQTDGDSYENAQQFDGFRFVNDKHPESAPSDIFMSFGHGHHACPGRRFALMVVKFLVIDFLTKYEYEELLERPTDFIFGAGIMPDLKKEIRVRPLAGAGAGAGAPATAAVVE